MATEQEKQAAFDKAVEAARNFAEGKGTAGKAARAAEDYEKASGLSREVAGAAISQAAGI